MARTKISEFSATPANNTDIDSINIAEGCAPSGINDAIRELMAQLKDFQTGAVGDSFNGPVGTTTAAAGAFTTLAASGAVTLSGGTANGVPYLNGSKVLTSGSALVFDGTNLGIGTSSPAQKLSVSSAAAGDASSIRITNTDTGATSIAAFQMVTGISANSWQMFTRNNSLNWGVAGVADYMNLNSSGNLGLGVAPSAWNNSIKALQVNNAALASFTSGGNVQTWLANNAYYDNATGWLYKNSSVGAALYAQSFNGSHNWNIAPSGTAGNAISFTQAMTLTAGGSLGLGETSPDTKLVVNNGSSAQTVNALFTRGASDANFRAGFANGSGISVNTEQAAVGMWYGTGFTNPLCHIGFLRGAFADGRGLTFNVGNTERARIDSSGNLLLGASSFQANTPRLYVTTSSQGSGSNNAVWVNDSASTASAAMHVWSFSQTTASSGAFVDAYYNGVTTLAFRIAGNGNVTNINNSYGSTSDIKLKENIVDATPKLAGLMQVKVRNYNMIGDTTKQIGVVAQELETVFPAMVDESPDRDAEGNDLGTTTKGVKYSVFVPMLIKAMQEQQALITILQADVAALKAAA